MSKQETQDLVTKLFQCKRTNEHFRKRIERLELEYGRMLGQIQEAIEILESDSAYEKTHVPAILRAALPEKVK